MTHAAKRASYLHVLMRTLALALVLLLAVAGCDKPAEQPKDAGASGEPKTPKAPAGPELAKADRDIVFGVGASDLEDPAAAGKAAAEQAKGKVGDSPVKAVLVAESYEDQPRKAKILEAVCAVFDKSLVFGEATYGAFTQAGVNEGEAVAVLVIAGKDIAVTPVVQAEMGTKGLTLENDKDKLDAALKAAGEALGKQVAEKKGKLMVIVADAHSPKNGPLVEGIQGALGKDFPLTGGSANKNAGQTFVYYQGKMLTDSVVGLMLDGNFQVALAGRQAKENDKVIATAKEGAAEALAGLKAKGAKPAAVLAFNCAGRKGKLKKVADELAAMQGCLGEKLPLFGTYNAGEIGPADLAEKTPDVLSSGVGWHVMFSVIGW